MIKRLFDIIVSIAAILVLLPVIIGVAFIIRLKLGSPIFFQQVRPGRDGRPFKMIKFRTMLDAYDADGAPLPNASRMTPFGNWLRSTSLDELPELWNVIKGDMSLVGPRPLLMDYLPLYTEEQFRRHEVKPGVTGWAQINGRNSISWDEKFKLDVWYVDNSSFMLDLKILILTLKKVIKRDGVNATPDTTMTRFTGGDK